MRRSVAALALIAGLGREARGDEPYERVTVSLNVPVLLLPVVELDAEIAVNRRWSVGLRGGAGRFEAFGQSTKVAQLSAHGAFYPLGTVRRGMQLGMSMRTAGTEGDSKLMGLDDGLAAGPFIGYRRVFGSGITLTGQLGAEIVIAGESDGRVLPFLGALVGVSFWSTGAPATEAAAASAPPDERPLAYHRRLMFGFGLGGGAVTTESCDACEVRGSMAVDASVGWFVHERVAIEYDATVTVGVLSNLSGSAGFGLHGVAVQVWPHDDVSVKVCVGAARLLGTSLLEGPTVRNGGGGALAVGYELHHRRGFAIDLQLRATHGSFEEGDDTLGVNTFTGTLGTRWY